MKKLKLTPATRRELQIDLKKIIGQLQTLSNVFESGEVTDQVLIQLLASKGGITRVCREVISKGVLTQINDYTEDEITNALNIIFKL